MITGGQAHERQDNVATIYRRRELAADPRGAKSSTYRGKRYAKWTNTKTDTVPNVPHCQLRATRSSANRPTIRFSISTMMDAEREGPYAVCQKG